MNNNLNWKYGLALLLVVILVFSGGLVIGSLLNTNKNQTPDVRPQPSETTGEGAAQGESNGAIPNSTGNETPSEPMSKTYNLYFQKYDPETGDNFQVAPVKRSTTRADVATFLVEEFLKGPTQAEKAQNLSGMNDTFNGDSNCNGRDFTISNTEGILTVQFCRPIFFASDFSIAVNQGLKKTLEEIPTVQKVMILEQTGHCYNDLSGLDVCKN